MIVEQYWVYRDW